MSDTSLVVRGIHDQGIEFSSDTRRGLKEELLDNVADYLNKASSRRRVRRSKKLANDGSWTGTKYDILREGILPLGRIILSSRDFDYHSLNAVDQDVIDAIGVFSKHYLDELNLLNMEKHNQIYCDEIEVWKTRPDKFK